MTFSIGGLPSLWLKRNEKVRDKNCVLFRRDHIILSFIFDDKVENRFEISDPSDHREEETFCLLGGRLERKPRLRGNTYECFR